MNPLQRTIVLFEKARNSIVDAMVSLGERFEKGDWKEKYETWGEFVEEGLKISQGFASKLLAVNRHFLQEGKVSQRKLKGIDIERLYLAIHTSGSPLKQLEKARLLSRSEIQDEVREKKSGVCDHIGKPFEVYHRCQCSKWLKQVV